MVGALGRASRGTSAARPWGRWEEGVVRGWRAWARLARTSAARPWGRWGERVVRGHYAVGFRRWEESVVRGWRAWARLAWHFCRASVQSIQSSGTEGQAASHTDASVKGAHVANREFALLFGAAFCDDFEEFSDIQVLWADMFAPSAFDTLVRCCRLCGEP